MCTATLAALCSSWQAVTHLITRSHACFPPHTAACSAASGTAGCTIPAVQAGPLQQHWPHHLSRTGRVLGASASSPHGLVGAGVQGGPLDGALLLAQKLQRQSQAPAQHPEHSLATGWRPKLLCCFRCASSTPAVRRRIWWIFARAAAARALAGRGLCACLQSACGRVRGSYARKRGEGGGGWHRRRCGPIIVAGGRPGMRVVAARDVRQQAPGLRDVVLGLRTQSSRRPQVTHPVMPDPGPSGSVRIAARSLDSPNQATPCGQRHAGVAHQMQAPDRTASRMRS